MTAPYISVPFEALSPDTEYEVHVESYDEDEGCCEAVLADTATVYRNGQPVGTAPLAEAVAAVAAFWDESLDQAHRRIEDKCTEAAAERWSEDAADARARWQEDRADEGRWF